MWTVCVKAVGCDIDISSLCIFLFHVYFMYICPYVIYEIQQLLLNELLKELTGNII